MSACVQSRTQSSGTPPSSKDGVKQKYCATQGSKQLPMHGLQLPLDPKRMAKSSPLCQDLAAAERSTDLRPKLACTLNSLLNSCCKPRLLKRKSWVVSVIRQNQARSAALIRLRQSRWAKRLTTRTRAIFAFESMPALVDFK